MRILGLLAFAAALVSPGKAQALIPLQPQGQSQDQTQTGSISGTVTDAATQQPVKRAMINLWNATASIQSSAASTDSSGAFHIDHLAAGKWTISASHPDYPTPGSGSSKTVDVASGETTSSINLTLLPGASITGQVTDEDGDPMQGCFVAVHSPDHPNQQRGSVPSDEDGQYHISRLSSGKYLVSAQCSRPVFTPRPFSAGPDPPPSRAYPTQFYPLAPDAKSAQPITLVAGTEKSGVDFRMRPAPVTQVRGSFSPSSAAEAEQPGTIIQLYSPNDVSFPGGVPVNRNTGTFEFQTVFPGSYILIAVRRNFEKPLGVFQQIEVKDHPLDLVLDLAPGVDLTGSITVENDNPASPVPLNQVQIRLFSDIPMFVTAPRTQVNADGTFVIKGVLGAHWRISANAPGAFLKSAWLGPTEITHSTFDLSAASEPLRLVLSTNMGSVAGTGPPGSMAYLASDQQNMLQQIDASGRFTWPNIAPGTYRVGIMTSFGGQIPEDGGQPVTVHEGESVSIDLKPDNQ